MQDQGEVVLDGEVDLGPEGGLLYPPVDGAGGGEVEAALPHGHHGPTPHKLLEPPQGGRRELVGSLGVAADGEVDPGGGEVRHGGAGPGMGEAEVGHDVPQAGVRHRLAVPGQGVLEAGEARVTSRLPQPPEDEVQVAVRVG